MTQDLTPVQKDKHYWDLSVRAHRYIQEKGFVNKGDIVRAIKEGVLVRDLKENYNFGRKTMMELFKYSFQTKFNRIQRCPMCGEYIIPAQIDSGPRPAPGEKIEKIGQ